MGSFINSLPYIISTSILGLVTFILKNTFDDIKMLQQEVKTKISESECRQLIDDKTEHVKEDLSEIKAQLNKITEFLLTKK